MTKKSKKIQEAVAEVVKAASKMESYKFVPAEDITVHELAQLFALWGMQFNDPGTGKFQELPENVKRHLQKV